MTEDYTPTEADIRAYLDNVVFEPEEVDRAFAKIREDADEEAVRDLWSKLREGKTVSYHASSWLDPETGEQRSEMRTVYPQPLLPDLSRERVATVVVDSMRLAMGGTLGAQMEGAVANRVADELLRYTNAEVTDSHSLPGRENPFARNWTVADSTKLSRKLYQDPNFWRYPEWVYPGVECPTVLPEVVSVTHDSEGWPADRRWIPGPYGMTQMNAMSERYEVVYERNGAKVLQGMYATMREAQGEIDKIAEVSDASPYSIVRVTKQRVGKARPAATPEARNA